MKAPFPLPDIVLKDVRAGQPRDVLRHMTEALERAEGCDGPALLKLLLDAETIGGSSIGDGVAVVSARVPNAVTSRRLCAFAQLNKAVAFRGMEQNPCDLVFIMASPDDEAQAHLRDLSTIVRTMRDRDFCDRLRKAPNSERAAHLFRARDMAISQAA